MKKEIAIFSIIAVLAALGIWFYVSPRKIDNFQFGVSTKQCKPGDKCLCAPFCVKTLRGNVPFDPTYSDLNEWGQYESLGCPYTKSKGQWDYITVRDPQFAGV